MDKQELIPGNLFTVLENSGIKELYQNGARKKDIILKSNQTKKKYKISINSESIEHQSYAKIYQWSEREGWNLILNKSPKNDFGIDIAYDIDYEKNIFDSIIINFSTFIENWEL